MPIIALFTQNYNFWRGWQGNIHNPSTCPNVLLNIYLKNTKSANSVLKVKSILFYLILFRYSQPWIWITSTLKRYNAYRCLNIISNVLFLLKYNIVTTLSLTKWERELKWSDDSCVFYFVILNQSDMFLVHNQLMFCTNFTIIKWLWL